MLRSRSLLATVSGAVISAEDLFPDRLRKPAPGASKSEQSHWTEERENLKKTYEILLPYYHFRAECLITNPESSILDGELDRLSKMAGSSYLLELRHDSVGMLKLVSLTLVDISVRFTSCPQDWIRKIEQVCCKSGWIDLRLCLAEKAIAHVTAHSEALRLVDTVAQYALKNPSSAHEQVTTLMRCARIGDVVDAAAGRRYFELAVEAASEIDEEAIAQLQLLDVFALRAAQDDSALRETGLALIFARYAEECHRRLEGWDHFPWTQVVNGVATLDPVAALATLCRWDQRGIRDFTEEVVPVIHASAKRGHIALPMAAGLAILADPDDGRITDFWIDLLNRALAQPDVRQATTGLLEQFAEDILLHTPLNKRCRHATELCEWAHLKGIAGGSKMAQLRRLHDFSSELTLKTVDQHSPKGVAFAKSHSKDDDSKVNWDSILEGKKFTTSAEIDEALRLLFGDRRLRPELAAELFQKMAARCHPSDFLAHLDALVGVTFPQFALGILLGTVKARLQDWKFHPAIRDWPMHAVERILRGRGGPFYDGDRFSDYYVREVADALGLDQGKVRELAVRNLPDVVDSLSAACLHSLASALVFSLPSGGAREILSSVLPRWYEDLKCRKTSVDDLTPESLTCLRGHEPFTDALWYLMGHPDKRLRWRAVHAARRCVRLGHREIIGALANQLDDLKCVPLLPEGRPFYWLGARLWFFLLLDRLTADVPCAVLPLTKLLVTEVLQPKLPHALIQHVAKRAALRLATHSTTTIRPTEVRMLQAALSSRLPMIKEDWSATRDRCASSRSGYGTRFSFDTMDTMPYWYEPLGALFAVSAQEVAKKSEHWICDVWRERSHIGEADPARRWSHSTNWALTSSRHGSEPTIERFNTYLEFHAMFCAAVELLVEKPLVECDSKSDPWAEWLAQWDLAWQDGWISDRRDPTPLERRFWIKDDTPDDDWSTEPNDAAFDMAVGLQSTEHKGFVVGQGDNYRFYYDDYEHTSVASALVAPERADALLRALQTTSDPSDYRIPDQGNELEINEGEFKLQGWLKCVLPDHEGIDSHDPLRNELDRALITPGSLFCDWAGLISNETLALFWRKRSPETAVTMFEHWNDMPRNGYHGGFRSEGKRLLIRTGELLRFLKCEGWSLIIKCELSRHIKRGSHEDTEESSWRPKAKLYLIRADGVVQTIRGSFVLGEASR